MRSTRIHPAKEIEPQGLEQYCIEFAAAIIALVRDADAGLPAPVAERLVAVSSGIGAQVTLAREPSVSRRASLLALASARRASHEIAYWLKLAVAIQAVPEDTARSLLQDAMSLHIAVGNQYSRIRQAGEAPK